MKKVLVILLLSLMLCSCWDRMEIEEIGIVIGVAFDPHEDKEEQENKEAKRDVEDKRFNSTFHVAIPSGFIEGLQTGGPVQPFFNVTANGVTNFKMLREISARRSRSLNFEHIKAFIIHEELARAGFIEHLIDIYIRDHEMRRRVDVFISSEEAKSFFEEALPLEEMPAISYMMINENYWRVLGQVRPKKMGDLSEDVIGNRSFVVPRIRQLGKNDVIIIGGAVFSGKNNQMVGWLDEEDVKGYNWIIGEVESGIIEAKYKDGAPIVFETQGQGTEIVYTRQNGQDVFNIELRAEGALTESWMHNVEIDNETNIEEFEKIFAKEIEEQVNQIITKMQNEFYCDIFGLSQKVKQKEYGYWKEIKQDWDGEEGYFRQAKINVEAAVKIRHYMLQERQD